MKYTISLMLALLCLTAVETEWHYVGETDTFRFYHTSKNPPPPRRGERLAWEKQVERGDTKEGREERDKTIKDLGELIPKVKAKYYGYTLHLRNYDCIRRRSRFLRTLFYDVFKNVIYEMPDAETAWQYPTPDSVDDALMEDACTGVQ